MDLSRLTVIEISEAIAGPTAGQVLADLGASVIKVENPQGGDSARRQGDLNLFNSGSLFHVFNRGKRSVALDLKQAEHLDALLHFIETRADVLVQNLRPGTLDRLGLGAAALRERAPRLVHCSISGFPYGSKSYHKPGYDLILQAFSGILHTTGEPDRDPVRLGISAVDQVAGMWAVTGIIDALAKREATGRGAEVHISLLEAAVFLMTPQIGQYQFSGKVPRRWGTGLKEFVPLRVYRTADGQIAMAAATDKLFRALAECLGRPEIATSPDYLTVRDRERNRVALDALIEESLATAPSAEWIARFDAHGIATSPVNSVKELLESEELAASGQLGAPEGMEGFKVVRSPYRLDGERPPTPRRSERLGESTDWFLAEARPVATAPPTQLFVEDFSVGQRFEGAWHRLDQRRFLDFAALTGDDHPIHYDPEYAKHTRFGRPVAHGLLLTSLTAVGATEMSARLADAMVAFLGVEANFTAPVFLDDRVRPVFEVVSVELTPDKPVGVLTLAMELHRENGDVCLRGKHKYLLKRRPR